MHFEHIFNGIFQPQSPSYPPCHMSQVRYWKVDKLFRLNPKKLSDNKYRLCFSRTDHVICSKWYLPPYFGLIEQFSSRRQTKIKYSDSFTDLKKTKSSLFVTKSRFFWISKKPGLELLSFSLFSNFYLNLPGTRREGKRCSAIR